jgi:hypothetical protein
MAKPFGARLLKAFNGFALNSLPLNFCLNSYSSLSAWFKSFARPALAWQTWKKAW